MNDEIDKAILRLFFDTSNRPKKSPMYESLIQRRLEPVFTQKQVSYALKRLESDRQPLKKRLKSRVVRVKKIGRLRFYYPAVLANDKNGRLSKKIDRIVEWVKKYSNPEKTSMLGDHLHHLVKAELRAQQFEIVDEHTNTFNGKTWKTGDNLDVIAKHKTKNIAIGVEMKNSFDLISRRELNVKIAICKYLDITPIFACRTLGQFQKIIQKHDGFGWEFKRQIYPLGQEEFVEKLQKKFNLPVEVRSDLPLESVKILERWLDGLNSNI